MSKPKAYYNEINPHAAEWLRRLIAHGHIAPGDVDTRSIEDVQPDDLAGYCQVHLFAGIAGWSIALRLAGWSDDRPVWTCSLPCQPFSFAGKEEGHEDPRHLWPQSLRLVRFWHPPAILMEQVTGAIRHGWLDGVGQDLEAENYAIGSAVLSKSAVDAPDRRDRLWIVAHSERHEQSWQEPRRGADRRVGREQQLLPWDGGWPAALARFRAMDDGLPRCVAGTDAARNSICPQVAAQFIGAYLDVLAERVVAHA